MFSGHDNPTSSAAAAAEAPVHENQSAQPAETTPAAPLEHAAVEPAAVPAGPSPETHVKADEAHAKAEAHAQNVSTDAEAAAAAEEAAGAEEMSKLIEQYSEPQEAVAQNEVIEVKVVAYTEQGVMVDIGGKTEGLIPAAEFTETDVPRPEPNSTIEVQRTGETKDGYVILSYQKVLRRRTWERIDAQYKAKETITAKVVDRIKGGLVVDIGVRAFLPGSQFDLRPTANLDDLMGKEVQVRVTKLNRRRGNVVVSRRALLEEELHAKRAELMENLHEGQTVHGVVKNVTDYGAFVDLGGIDGLLHLTDLSWGRVRHPSDVVKPEQELDLVILKFDKTKQRVSLGL
jgi:small subunit ribosomal protein S1